MRSRAGLVCAACLIVSQAAWGRPLEVPAQAVIPANAFQVISVDYRALQQSAAAGALQQHLFLEPLRHIDGELTQAGIDPATQVTRVVFALYGSATDPRRLAIAEGTFRAEPLRQDFDRRQVAASTHRATRIYAISPHSRVAFLDDHTVLLGDQAALRDGLNTRDGIRPGLATRADGASMTLDETSAPIWSVLDREGTLNLIESLLGGRSRVVNATVSRNLVGSRYTIDPSNGMRFELDVLTSGPRMASALSLLLRAGTAAMTIGASPADARVLGAVRVAAVQSRTRVRLDIDRAGVAELLRSSFIARAHR